MKIILMLMLLQFQPIPDECRFTESLFKYIHPSDSIVWWQAENIDFEKNKTEILFCSDTTLRPEKQILLMKNTFPCFYHDFLIGPTHEFCLIYRTVSEKKYITKKEELKDFIGTVDNLQEAVLLAYLYDLVPGNTKSTSSFYKKDDTYFLNLKKVKNPPDVYSIVIVNGKVIEQEPEVFKIKVCNNGDVFLFDGKTEEYRKLILSDVYQWR